MILVLVLFAASYVHAESDGRRGIVSYGEHCGICGQYGYCSREVSREEAVGALRRYYEKRGLAVLVIRERERFLEAVIHGNGMVVDRVLFDVRTGRIRSIY